MSVVAQALHALSFAAYHTTCIALVSRYFPGRLRGRGQALFTVVGYGVGGAACVFLGGAIARRFGFATVCAWQLERLEPPSTLS